MTHLTKYFQNSFFPACWTLLFKVPNVTLLLGYSKTCCTSFSSTGYSGRFLREKDRSFQNQFHSFAKDTF